MTVCNAGPVYDSEQRAQESLLQWYETCQRPQHDALNWSDYAAMVESVNATFESLAEVRRFSYRHPVALQDPDWGVGKPYEVPVAYSDSLSGQEVVVAIGGILNTKERFDFLARDAKPALRLLSLDLLGRGDSGWLWEQTDYHLDTYLELLCQFIDHLGVSSCTLLGSSLGASIAIAYAARFPERVNRIILNDTGPLIPANRRQRRAKAVARHYVFRSPSDFFRKTTASAKHDGLVPDAVLLYNQHYKTHWSDQEQGRVYCHDLRALLAYRSAAQDTLTQWEEWGKIQCPMLLLHGLESDALQMSTVEDMSAVQKEMSVIHVHDTGHTPSLSDGALNQIIVEWVLDDAPVPRQLYFQRQYFPDMLFFHRSTNQVNSGIG